MVFAAKVFRFFFSEGFTASLFVLLLVRSVTRRQTMTKILLVLATILATVGAYCPNGCSKNGSCGVNGEADFQLLALQRSVLLLTASSPHSFSQTNARVTTVPMATRRGRRTIVP